jgi:hypothetical protein
MSRRDECFTFRQLLRQGSWSVAEDTVVVDRTAMRRIVAGCVDRLAPGIAAPGGESSDSRRRLVVFITSTQLQAVIAYFIASELRLTASVISARQAASLFSYLDPAVVHRVVLGVGTRLAAGAPPDKVIRLHFGPSDDVVGLREPPLTPFAAHAQLVFLTSGSTGAPKCVLCDEDRLVRNAFRVAGYLGQSPSDRTLCLFPVTFMYGFSTLLCALHSGGHVRFSHLVCAPLVVDAVRRYEISLLPVIGDWAIELTQFWRSFDRPLPRVTVLNASDRLLRTLAAHLLSFAERVWNNYGQTESGPRLLALELNRDVPLDEYCYGGVVAPGRRIDDGIGVEIRDSSAHVPDAVGTLYYSTPFAMRGYLNPAGELVPASDWINSGDLFTRGRDGVYGWMGRTEMSVKVGGRTWW